jgi:AcrR family transcriptional regulator
MGCRQANRAASDDDDLHDLSLPHDFSSWRKRSTYHLRMEKTSRDRLVDAGLEVLGRDGGARFSVRSTEGEADLPHGSVRHHFGGLDGLVDAMVEHLLRAEMESALDRPVETLQGWLGPHRVRTQARYELMTRAFRTPRLREVLTAARERVITDVATDSGIPRDRAAVLVAALDGLVLDALVRGVSEVRQGAIELLGAQPGRGPHPSDDVTGRSGADGSTGRPS